MEVCTWDFKMDFVGACLLEVDEDDDEEVDAREW
jgi:hypothetical protein